jgi:class 3 adenylate cyclase
MDQHNSDHHQSEGNNHAVDEAELRRQIEDYYLPTQLVDAIMEVGGILKESTETDIGVGFLDIADYTSLSIFLSPRDNQAMLNGLYTAFNGVLKRHGGYLNKIEGDSIMFHFGGLIDPVAKRIEQEQGPEVAKQHVARELFYTCVEMQRVCQLFNAANRNFLLRAETAETREVLQRAFAIINELRTNELLQRATGALFQIRIRIGASFGNVTIGNFGPDGAKQWDVIGPAVIEAKRMESTAPVGGLRISEGLYSILDQMGITKSYYDRFRREAQALSSHYRDITRDDLFREKPVLLKDKRNAKLASYSVQVSSKLPEDIAAQVELLLERDQKGAEMILGLLEYYRGNRYVIRAIEDTFKRVGVRIRKAFILETMYPTQYEKIAERFNNNTDRIEEHLDSEFSLFDLLDKLGKFQDIVKQRIPPAQKPEEFLDFASYMSDRVRETKDHYDRTKKNMIQRAYFFNVVFPLVFDGIMTSILEYQQSISAVQLVEE